MRCTRGTLVLRGKDGCGGWFAGAFSSRARKIGDNCHDGFTQTIPISGSKRMNWVLFVVLASTSGSEKAINSTAVPMATEQLCNAAKAKLTQAYQKTQGPNYVLVTECLQAR
jgi:hypothetical protein